ncbi:hypothetical protein HKX48_008187 [Thoreauomyces humboldtii]|nr:hypothetical protein HKX48_008187 [Thoreauomyces humboldtii]
MPTAHISPAAHRLMSQMDGQGSMNPMDWLAMMASAASTAAPSNHQAGIRTDGNRNRDRAAAGPSVDPPGTTSPPAFLGSLVGVVNDRIDRRFVELRDHVDRRLDRIEGALASLVEILVGKESLDEDVTEHVVDDDDGVETGETGIVRLETRDRAGDVEPITQQHVEELTLD